jgi:HemY protein
MRFGAWALAALMLGAFGAHFLLQDRGYVLINFRSYVIEMSVPVLVLVLILLYALVRLGVRLWRAPRQLGESLAGRRFRKAGGKLTQGMIHMTEGDWRRGERLLTEGLRGGDTPLVNYLMAARAAQLQGSRERRNEWLKLAYETLPDAEAAVLLTQAELQFEDGEFEHALATLKRVEDKQGDHPAGLALLARTHLALDDRKSLVELLPRLTKARLPADQLARFAAEAMQSLLVDKNLTYEGFRALWSGLPTTARRQPVLERMRALVLDRLGRGDEAVKELGTALKRSWDPELVRAYGEVRGADPLQQLKRAEGWLRQHGDDSTLLMTAARLSMANELWGKARSYLESSIALAPEPAAYALYGKLLDQLGEGERAAEAYHAGLRLVAPGDDTLPALAPPRARATAED